MKLNKTAIVECELKMFGSVFPKYFINAFTALQLSKSQSLQEGIITFSSLLMYLIVLLFTVLYFVCWLQI